MKRVQLYDKCFKLYLPYSKIQKAIDKVAEKINEDLKDIDTPIFLGVLTGSFMFTADLMKRINFPCDIVFIRLASYEGTSTTGEVKQIMGLTKSVKDKTVIVVEDVVDTGCTIMEMDKILRDSGAKNIKVCTLLYKPDSYKGNVKIDYRAMEIPNDFIVGFGLDYNQMGRQYKDIYVLDEAETQKRLLINKK